MPFREMTFGTDMSEQVGGVTEFGLFGTDAAIEQGLGHDDTWELEQ